MKKITLPTKNVPLFVANFKYFLYFCSRNQKKYSYARDKFIFTIKEGIITGSLPRRALRMVYEWLDQHQDEFLANWERLGRSEEPIRIDPLQ